MTFLITGVALDMAQVLERLVLFHYLGSIYPSVWIAFLTTMLVFLGGLGLSAMTWSRDLVT